MVTRGGGGTVFSAFGAEADMNAPLFEGMNRFVSVGFTLALLDMEIGAEVEVVEARGCVDDKCVTGVAVAGAPEANAAGEPGKEGEGKRTDELPSGAKAGGVEYDE